MPIYGYGLIGAPWVFCDTITKKKYMDIINCLKSVMNDDKFHPSFIHSIKLSNDDTTFLASYDISKTNIDAAYYQEYMDKLIAEANTKLNAKKKYNNYKIDITGSFTIGKIIIMEKK